MHREIVIRIPNEFVACQMVAALRNSNNQNVAEVAVIDDLASMIQRALDESTREKLNERID